MHTTVADQGGNILLSVKLSFFYLLNVLNVDRFVSLPS